MQRMFRGRYVAELRPHRDRCGLDPVQLTQLLDTLMSKTWNIYAKPVLGHAPQVLAYLGRYTHRIALAESRLLAIQDDKVLFRYRNYRQGNKPSVMALAGTEFMQRYLNHVVPRGFKRVRHYGFLANRVRRRRIGRIQALLPVRCPRKNSAAPHHQGWICPSCGTRNVSLWQRTTEAPDTS
jgi:hypothetical protein